jgi:hypothetical protein
MKKSKQIALLQFLASKFPDHAQVEEYGEQFDENFGKGGKGSRQLLSKDFCATLEILTAQGIITMEWPYLGAGGYEISITPHGIAYLESQKPISKLTNILIPTGGVSSYFWGCITGVIGTVLGQILLRYFGLTGK